MRQRIRTDDIAYLHFDRGHPKLIVIADDPALAEGYDWSDLKLPVLAIDTKVIDYDTLHSLLHTVIGNDCRGRFTMKPYRHKQGSAYGRIIRHGGKDSTALEGCADLPLFDIDAIEIEDSKVVSLVELKHRGERLTRAQRLVIARCRDLGIEYVEDENPDV